MNENCKKGEREKEDGVGNIRRERGGEGVIRKRAATLNDT